MATYYQTTNTQRDAGTMIYLKENYQGTYQEAQGNMMIMNYPSSYGSYSDTVGSNVEVGRDGEDSSQNGQQEMLSNLGEWRDGRNEMMLVQPIGTSLHGQGLSLSLGTQIPLGIQVPSIQFRSLGQGFTSFLETNGSVDNGGSIDVNSLDNNQSAFGISSISRPISNSRYLKAAQELLDEVVNVKKALKLPEFDKNQSKNESKRKCSNDGDDGSNEHSAGEPSDTQESHGKNLNELSPAERNDFQNKLTKLLSMLDEVTPRKNAKLHFLRSFTL